MFLQFPSLPWLLPGLEPFSLSAPSCDWQCTEFSGSLPLSLTCACVELLGLPEVGAVVGGQLLQALYAMAKERDREEDVLALVNALALLFISLPVSALSALTRVACAEHAPPPCGLLQECYHSVLYDNVVAVVEGLAPETAVLLALAGGNPPACLLSLMHAFWLHGNMGLLLLLPQ